MLYFFDAMFNDIPFFITIIFILVFGIILFRVFKSISQWLYNNKQEVLTKRAKVIDKRSDVRYHNSGNSHGSSTHTSYYITFEFDSGERQAFKVRVKEYEILALDDYGELTYQGSRYKGFNRFIQKEDDRWTSY